LSALISIELMYSRSFLREVCKLLANTQSTLQHSPVLNPKTTVISLKYSTSTHSSLDESTLILKR
jgi:hypothetical protein